jgi:hypothetical protein
VALGAALAALVVGLVWGTRVAGGSDSYCYLEQAERWAAGTIQTPQSPLFAGAPWLDPWLPLAPTGFIPSSNVPGAIAPICPAGFALTMVPFRIALGREGVHLVVPLLGAMAVWVTFLLGRALAGHAAGALAAALTAASPVFLYQVVQPMSDVPAMAWWVLAAWLVVSGGPRALVGAGLVTGAAVLTRPNLVPLAVVLLASVWFRPPEAGADSRVGRALRFCAGAAPGALAVALVQYILYGSVTSSGYGNPAALFSTSHIWPNIQRYGWWAIDTHTPVLLLAPLALVARPPAADASSRARGRWIATTLLALTAAVIACYLPYVPFDAWWFLRFLLPAVPFTFVLVASVLRAGTSRLPHPWSIVTLVAIGLVVCGLLVRTAVRRHAFEVKAAEWRFRLAGDYLARSLPQNAVVLTIWHSGSVRYYGHRQTVVWDAIPPDALDRTVDYLRGRGLRPFLLLERWEEPAFRARFGAASALAALDWPPLATVGRDVRVFAIDDRARYMAGERTPSEFVSIDGRAGRR